ncbi:MAG: LicD family protein [Eubacterium sp.]|nr:LicD family protein [Eubacterium sp.]
MSEFCPVYEGVDYTPVFSIAYYQAAYSDLRAAFGDDKQAYFQHFIDCGAAEGRQGKLDFSIREFLRQHPGLQGKFGSDLGAYYREVLTNPKYQKDLYRPYIGIHVEEGADMELLHHAQRCNLILLRELDRVCRKYQLKYYLICGTLLGAVRHKSFVPWDDDADIAMTRDDFNVLKKNASKEWDGSTFLFLEYDQMGKGVFLDYMSRLVYMKEDVPVITYQKIRGKGRSDIDSHIPLDIYILDNASDNEKKHYYQTLALQGIYGLGMGHRAYIDHSEYSQAPAGIRRKVKLLVSVGRILPLKFIFWLYERVRQMYNRQETGSYIMSNGFIFCLPWKFDKKWFGNGSVCTIDDVPLMAPANCDAYLKKQYGDYMKLPALEDRRPTHTLGASGIFYTVDYNKGTERL